MDRTTILKNVLLDNKSSLQYNNITNSNTLTIWCSKMEPSRYYRAGVKNGHASTTQYSPKLDHSNSSEIRKLLERPPLEINESSHHKQYGRENKKKMRCEKARLKTCVGLRLLGNFYSNRPYPSSVPKIYPSTIPKNMSSVDSPVMRSILMEHSPTLQQLCRQRTQKLTNATKPREIKPLFMNSIDKCIPTACYEPSRETRLSEALSSELRKLLGSNETVKVNTQAESDCCNFSPTLLPLSVENYGASACSQSACGQPVFPSPLRVCEANDGTETLVEGEGVNNVLDDPTLARAARFVSRAVHRTPNYNMLMK